MTCNICPDRVKLSTSTLVAVESQEDIKGAIDDMELKDVAPEKFTCCVSLLQLSARSAPFLALPAPAAAGCRATTMMSSRQNVFTSGTEVATATATTSWPERSASGRVRSPHRASGAPGRLLPPESRVLEQDLPPEGHLKANPEQEDPHLMDHQPDSHATWGGFLQFTVAWAPPADRPWVLPDRPTEADSICGYAGLHLPLLHSNPAQLQGKTLKTQGARWKAHSLLQHLHRWPHNAVKILPTCWRSPSPLGPPVIAGGPKNEVDWKTI